MQDFLVKALLVVEESRDGTDAAGVRLQRAFDTLGRRTASLAEDNAQLKRDVVRRGRHETELLASLRSSEEKYKALLAQAQLVQGQLRRLSRNILSAQEEERKEISRELHDEVAQTLAGIGMHLAALKDAASVNTLALRRRIARTQLFVERSVKIVHRFARELRPTVLDDLGLIPALRSYIKTFSERTGLRVGFNAAPAAEYLNSAKRTVIYRVAQEALTNVARHAKASTISVKITKRPRAIGLEVTDNGRAFKVERVLSAIGSPHLGLIGMRERVEMIGGEFRIKSVPGKGTAISAVVPLTATPSH
jgi:signal transduction histidine kinase